MGYAKRLLDEVNEAHYNAPEDVFVCPNCVSDSHVAHALRNSLEDECCSYCDAEEAANISVLLECLADTVKYYFSDPADELPWDGREGGYQGYVIDGYQMIQDELNDWTEDDVLLEDVSQAFSDGSWCKKDYAALTQYESLKWGWEEFAEQVKHKTRFLFFPEADPNHIEETDGLLPQQMLSALGTLFQEYALFGQFDAHVPLHRARVVSLGDRPNGPDELGTAPFRLAKSPNRMSPAGIPMFYAAFDPHTAVLETYDASMGQNCGIALAQFVPLRPLRVLNLTSLPDIPSRYDVANRGRRDAALFLHAFEQDLTKPIERDGMAHAEYAPTQVITEYVRHRLRHPDGGTIDGIVYQSSRSTGGKAIVVFADPAHCGPRPSRKVSDPEPFLELRSVEYYSAPTPTAKP